MAQEHFDRLTAVDASFLHQEGPTSHMHVGAVTIFEGPPPPYEEVARARARRACTSCRATARSSRSRRSRPGGRCGSTTRRSTSSTTCATPRCPRPGSEEQLHALAGADLLPAARPLEAAVGDVARRGARARATALRADLQDPPRADRRRLRRRPRDRAVRPRARSRRAAARPTRAVAAAARAVARPSSSPPARGRSCAAGCRPADARGRRCSRARARALRERARARPRASARSSGPA